MPEKFFKKLNNSILPQWKVCFIAALFVGLLAHLYKITGWIPNWDSLVFRYDEQNMIALGRWFLPVACSFSSFYDLPFLNGILAIILHAISAVFVCKMFGVRKKITAALLGAVIVSFPTVTSVLMYNYVADGYSIAFLLATLAALYMTKEKPNYIISALCITLSVAIYQAYLTVTIVLVLFKLIDDVIFGENSLGKILKNIGLMLLSGAVGMVLYSVALKVILAATSTELIEYQGVSTALSLSSIDIPRSLYVIKETILNYFFDISGGISVFVCINLLVFLLAIGYYASYVIKNKIYKKPLRLLIALVLVAMLPVGANILALINPQVDYHNLMLMGYSVFYVIFILIYERGCEKEEKLVATKRWVVLALSLVLIANHIVIANVSYHKAQMAYEKSYGTLIRITDRIEQTENGDVAQNIVVIGALEDSEAYSVTLPPEITGITDGHIIRADDEVVAQSVFCSTINDYCGKEYKFLAGEQKKAYCNLKEVKAMGVWPAKDSIKKIDDTIIVKLGVEGEK